MLRVSIAGAGNIKRIKMDESAMNESERYNKRYGRNTYNIKHLFIKDKQSVQLRRRAQKLAWEMYVNSPNCTPKEALYAAANFIAATFQFEKEFGWYADTDNAPASNERLSKQVYTCKKCEYYSFGDACRNPECSD